MDQTKHFGILDHWRIDALKAFRFLLTSLFFMGMFSIHASAQRPDDSAELLKTEADQARVQGNVTQAIDLYTKAVQLDSAWPDGWWYLGSLQYATNAYGPAVTALTHYIDLVPKAGPAFALRGLCEFEQKQYPKSLQDLQQAIALGAANQPKNAGILFYHEALLLTMFGRYEEALTTYGNMLKHGMASDEIIDGIGLAVLRLPMLPYEVDVKRSSQVFEAGKAAASILNDQIDAGGQEFEAFFREYPTLPNVHYSFGYLLSVAEPDAAIAQMQKELAIVPSSAIAHSMLAWILGTQGKYDEALVDAQKAVAENPSLVMAQLVLGQDLVETDNLQDALPHLNAVLSADPRNLDAHLALAKAYSEMGRKEDARRERLLCLTLTR